MKKLIKLRDFAAQRGITQTALLQWLYRQRKKAGDSWEELPKMDGVQAVEIGSDLYNRMNQKYPRPISPVEIVENVEVEKLRQDLIAAQRKTIEAQDKVEVLQHEIIKLRGEIAESKAMKLLADQAAADRDRAIEERDRAQGNAQEAEKARHDAEKVANEEKVRADQAEAKIAEMHGAGLWKRIRNKW